MEQLKYKIGEFSRLGRVTVRTLRHYGEIGLLKPEIIDRQTSYRYYSARQLQKLLAIVQLKELGFSLAEIRDLYEEDTHFPDIRMMERKIADCDLGDANKINRQSSTRYMTEPASMPYKTRSCAIW